MDRRRSSTASGTTSRPLLTQSSACCNGRGGGLVDHPRQQRCSHTHGASQARTRRSAWGHDTPTPAGAPVTVWIETLLGPPRGRLAGDRRRPRRGPGRCGCLARRRGRLAGVPAEAERTAHQRPVPPDRPVTTNLEVGPAELTLDLLIALLNPVA